MKLVRTVVMPKNTREVLLVSELKFGQCIKTTVNIHTLIISLADKD